MRVLGVLAGVCVCVYHPIQNPFPHTPHTHEPHPITHLQHPFPHRTPQPTSLKKQNLFPSTNKTPHTANAKGWDLLYSFKETYRVPDVSARSIHLASQRILHDSHYASRCVCVCVCSVVCVWLCVVVCLSVCLSACL